MFGFFMDCPRTSILFTLLPRCEWSTHALLATLLGCLHYVFLPLCFIVLLSCRRRCLQSLCRFDTLFFFILCFLCFRSCVLVLVTYFLHVVRISANRYGAAQYWSSL